MEAQIRTFAEHEKLFVLPIHTRKKEGMTDKAYNAIAKTTIDGSLAFIVFRVANCI